MNRIEVIGIFILAMGIICGSIYFSAVLTAKDRMSEEEMGKALRNSFGWLMLWWVLGPIFLAMTTWRRHYNIVVRLEATPNDLGLWMVLSDGRRIPLGDAYGRNPANARRSSKVSADQADVIVDASTGKFKLTAPGRPRFAPPQPEFVGTLVDILITSSGQGYWAATADGKLVCYGDARNFGSVGDPATYGIICRRQIKPVSLVRSFNGFALGTLAIDQPQLEPAV